MVSSPGSSWNVGWLDHLSDHVVEDTSMPEVGQLYISVEAQNCVKGTAAHLLVKGENKNMTTENHYFMKDLPCHAMEQPTQMGPADTTVVWQSLIITML